MNTSLSKEFHELVEFIRGLKNSYAEKTKQIADLENTLSLVKEELRLSKECEQNTRGQFVRALETITTVQRMNKRLNEIKDENVVLLQEKLKMRNEIRVLKTALQEEEKRWNQEKSDMIGKHNEEISWMKQIKDNEIISVRDELTSKQNELEHELQEIQNEMQAKEKCANELLSQTVRKYEQKLISLQDELTCTRIEVRSLKQKLNEVNHPPFPPSRAETPAPRSETPAPRSDTHSQRFETPAQKANKRANLSTISANVPPFNSLNSSFSANLDPRKTTPLVKTPQSRVPFPAARRRKLFNQTDDTDE